MNRQRKTIVLYPLNEKRHSIYDSTIEFLRENYNLVYAPAEEKKITLLTKLSRNRIILYLYHKLLRPIISFNSMKAVFRKKSSKRVPDGDLLFCSNALPPTTERNFIVDLEIVSALAGYDVNRLDRNKIKNFFSHPNCKAIICWNEISRKSLVETIDCRGFISKIKVIPFGITAENIKRRFGDNNLSLLFVSSINNPLDFERKGGIISLEAYARLIKRHPNLSLVIRAHVPPKMRRKYASLRGIKFIDEFISNDAMKKLMIDADLLFEPLPGINLVLECMKFGLPAVLMDFWVLSEMVENGKNGFVIPGKNIFGRKEPIAAYLRDMNVNYLKMYAKNPQGEVVNKFAEAAERLISEGKLREKMSNYAAGLVRDGKKYSLDRRNAELKKVLESSF